MTSKALPNNFHPARQLFAYSLKRTAGLTVLMTVVALLACPVYTLLKIERIYENTAKVYNLNTIAPTLMFITAIASVAAALVYMFINFAFLYSRSSSDFFHSLPTTRTGLLLARLISSVLPIIIPVTLVYGAMCGLKISKYVECSVMPILKGYAFNLLILFALAAFSLIFMICAGSIFDLIISFFTFNAGIVLVQIINSSLCSYFLRGYPYDAYTGSLVNLSSPYWFAFTRLGNLLSGELSRRSEITFAIALLIITFLSLAASLALYRRRKSEKSGISYAYNFIYTVCGLIVGIIAAFGAGAIFAEGEMSPVFWIFAAVGGVLAAITFGAINDRGFKSIKRSAVMGAVSVVMLGTFAAILATDCFGYSRRIPAAGKIESATVRFTGTEITFKDPETVLELHEKIVTESADNGDYLSLDYTLKSGRHFVRNYTDISYSDYMPLLLKLYKSPEHIKKIRSSISDSIISNRSVSARGYTVTDEGKAAPGYSYEEAVYEETAVTEAQLKKLVEAYISDLPKATYKSITDECLLSLEISGVDKSHKYTYIYLKVEETFENTLAVIKELNVKIS